MCCRCWEMTGNNDTLDNNVSWKNNWIKEFLLLWNFCLLFDQLGFFQFGPLYATCVLLREMGQKPFGLFFSFSPLFSSSLTKQSELQSWQFSAGNQYWTPYWRLLMHGQKTKEPLSLEHWQTPNAQPLNLKPVLLWKCQIQMMRVQEWKPFFSVH